MNRSIRRLGIALVVLFCALFAQLNYLQVVQAEKLANAPGNTRAALRDFSRARGEIVTSDGVVLARSVPSGDRFERQRQYPQGALFGHLTGFFSFTYGSDGLERTYSEELSGRTPETLRSLFATEEERTANLTLTISSRLQQAARDALGERRGSVVVLDPRNGAVRAMWSFPSYDPNPLAGHSFDRVRPRWDALNADPANPLLPRTFRETFAPGSTFKVVTAAAAAERRPDLAAKRYPVSSSLDLPQTNRNLPNFGGSSCGGALPDLVRVSCNTGFGQLGLDLGAEALTAEAADFGFGSVPPIDLPRAAASSIGQLRDRSPQLANSAIGQQDVRATPLQMALVAAAIGNGGTAMRPHVVDEVRDQDGEVVRRTAPEAWKTATTPEAAAQVRDAMVLVTEARGGTGTRARVPGVTVAGKTGTAQLEGDQSHAWFIGFAPAQAPTVAVAVIIEAQPGSDGQSGGRVAAPVAQAVLAAALQERR